MFKESAKEFKNLRSITTAALLVALHVVLSVFSIYITESLKVSIAFIANCVTALFFGPVVSLVCAGLGDVIGYIVKPIGPYFPGWTISAAIAGLAYGMVFYKKYPNEVKSENDCKSKNNNTGTVCNVCVQIISCAGIVLWFVMPFFSLKEKAVNAEEEIRMIFEKSSALNIIRDYSTHRNKTVCILTVFVLVVFFALLFANMMKKKLVPMQIALYAGCIIALAAYSDKKTIVMESGFYILIAMFYISAILNALILMTQEGIDIVFLLRCFLVMAFVAVFVNGMLGTYWCSIMYGKGFMYYFVSRMVKNLLQLPVNTMLAYVFIRKIKDINFAKYIINNHKIG